MSRDTGTRSKLLDVAQQLMLTKGFAATTVDEICQASGLTKGSFFYYFKSKDELGKAVLDYYWHQQQKSMYESAYRGLKDPLERLYGYLDFITQLAKDPLFPRSCLFGNFAQELSVTHPELRNQCEAGFAWWADELKHDLDQAKAEYAPDATCDTQGLAEHFIAVFEGSLILAKAKQDGAVIEDNVQHFKRYLSMIFEVGQKTTR